MCMLEKKEKIIFDKDFLLSLEDGQDSFTKDGITVNIDSGGFYFVENIRLAYISYICFGSILPINY